LKQNLCFNSNNYISHLGAGQILVAFVIKLKIGQRLSWDFAKKKFQFLGVGRRHYFIGGTRAVEYVSRKIFMMRSVSYSAQWGLENNGFLQARLLGVRSVRWQWVGCIVQARAVMSRAIG
jgi:hypothetical protein